LIKTWAVTLGKEKLKIPQKQLQKEVWFWTNASFRSFFIYVSPWKERIRLPYLSNLVFMLTRNTVFTKSNKSMMIRVHEKFQNIEFHIPCSCAWQWEYKSSQNEVGTSWISTQLKVMWSSFFYSYTSTDSNWKWRPALFPLNCFRKRQQELTALG
jgi:hypothetical protein